MSVKEIKNAEEFEAALKQAGDKLVVVDFFALWCGPCKKISPEVEKLAEERPNVVFLKVDVDIADDLAAKKKISAMPTFQFYKSMELKETFKGADFNKLKALVDKLQ